MSTTTIEGFDLRAPPPGFVDDPFPWYRRLREEAPVHRCPDGSWLLTRYDDCAAVYRSDAVSSDKTRLFAPKFGESPLFEHHTTSLVFSDPPYHTRVRATLTEALKPRAIQATVAVLERVVAQLLDAMAERGTVDFVDAFASRVPVEIISSLLTVPDTDRNRLRRWSLAILGALEPTLGAEEIDRGNRAVTEFLAYLRGLVDWRRREPTHADNDVLATLVALHDRGEISELELLHNCIFLLNAGHETTTNLIGNALYCLLEHPASLERVRARPVLLKNAIEEVLRFQSPNQLGNREVCANVTIGGVDFAPGDQITLCIGAANRDPAVFAEPERFDIDRSPNPHLAFGAGIHACAGMALARIEGKVAIGALLERFASIALAGAPVLRKRLRFRGFEALPVRVGG
jgi:cytochrome P450